MSGELLTAWTIRLALTCYVAYLAGWLVVGLRGERSTFWPSIARWLWTFGCVLFVIHVACAFHFYHDWSHAAAFEKTAAETEQLLGVRFGEGIYFSYAFLLLWVVDVIGLWVWPRGNWQSDTPQQPRPLVADMHSGRPLAAAMQWILHAYLFFIAFNGAIVFEAGPTRWAGVAACLVLGGLALRAAYNSQCGAPIAECGMPDKQTTSDLGSLNPEPRLGRSLALPHPTRRMPRPLKIAYLTAGAAGMICGSCLHDNTLARALIALGHDVQLIPLYTPIRTDEVDVASDRIFYGGINMYLQQKMSFFRWLPKWLDRWLDRPWLIDWAAGRSVKIEPQQVADLTLSILRGTAGFQRKEVERLAEWLTGDLQPDVIVFSNILTAGCVPEIKRRMNVPVVVTLQGDDIFLRGLPEPHQSQALTEIGKLIGQIDGFIANTRYYADHMADYLGIPRDRIEIVPLGIDTQDFVRQSKIRNSKFEIPTVGYLARLDPAKGLHILADAFIRLQKMPGMELARLKIAGWLGEQHRAYAEGVFKKLQAAGLADAFEYVGEVDRRGKLDFLASIDVLSVPTTYREPKGLFVLEALAAGVPVVQPDHGAFPEVLAEVGGGLLHRPEDPQHLAERLRELLLDTAGRDKLSQTGRTAVLSSRNQQVMAERTAEILQRVVEPNVVKASQSNTAQEVSAAERT